MKYIGAHVSTEGGVANAPLEAIAIGAKSFALFTGSSNRWTSKAILEGAAHAFKENCRRGGFTADQILPHDNFLINLGSPDPQKLHMSRKSFLEEMKRCEQLGLTMLNFHPGSHLNEIEEEKSLNLIAESINITLDKTDGVTAVLESTAGQGSNLGYRFEHLAHIIAKVEDKSRVGVCIDTCHTYSAGYDLADEEGYRKTWHDFDEIIGRSFLRAIHL
ncbi:MAG: deoxyribonuclease IV, partial [Muribaculaceae bacterium]|nr:deoxyribonuclease IV [Muribaculaceae bacterium]